MLGTKPGWCVNGPGPASLDSGIVAEPISDVLGHVADNITARIIKDGHTETGRCTIDEEEESNIDIVSLFKIGKNRVHA